MNLIEAEFTGDKPDDFISKLREDNPSLRHRCLHGDCYQFHLFLKKRYVSAVPYMNATRDHVVSDIGGHLYDITGRISEKHREQFHSMSAKEQAVASRWGFAKHRRTPPN